MVNKQSVSTKTMVRIALFAAIATVLYYVAEIPIIPGVENLKLDLSTIPTVVAGMILGIPAGLAVELIKNVLHLFKSSSLGIGEVINFLLGASMLIAFKLTFAFAEKKIKNNFASFIIAIIAAVLATIAMGLISNIALFPLYMKLIGQPMMPSAAFIAYLISTVTFNAIKPVVTIIPAVLLLKPLQKALK